LDRGIEKADIGSINDEDLLSLSMEHQRANPYVSAPKKNLANGSIDGATE